MCIFLPVLLVHACTCQDGSILQLAERPYSIPHHRLLMLHMLINNYIIANICYIENYSFIVLYFDTDVTLTETKTRTDCKPILPWYDGVTFQFVVISFGWIVLRTKKTRKIYVNTRICHNLRFIYRDLFYNFFLLHH